MAGPSVSSTASWWVKVKRANKHLRELKRAIRRYAHSHPYEPVGGVQTEDDHHEVAYDLRITRQPDPEIAAIVGDVAHNARAALDHIAVALAPRDRKGSAAFPIVPEDLWLKDGRRYRNRNAGPRRGYRLKIEGMDPRAQAIIKAAQPYNHGGEANIVAVLNRLENADKHKRLVITASAISDASVGVHIGGVGKVIMGSTRQYEDRTDVMRVTLGRPGPTPLRIVPLDDEMRRFVESVPQGEMDVESNATVTVAVKTRREKRSFDAIPILKLAIGEVSKILRDLEPFVDKGVGT